MAKNILHAIRYSN